LIDKAELILTYKILKSMISCYYVHELLQRFQILFYNKNVVEGNAREYTSMMAKYLSNLSRMACIKGTFLSFVATLCHQKKKGREREREREEKSALPRVQLCAFAFLSIINLHSAFNHGYKAFFVRLCNYEKYYSLLSQGQVQSRHALRFRDGRFDIIL